MIDDLFAEIDDTIIEFTEKRGHDNLEELGKCFFVSNNFRSKYSYAIPSKEAIHAILQFADEDLILEVGAGRGLWAKLLNDLHGKPVVFPTDAHTLDTNLYFRGGENWTPIEIIQSVDAIEKYKNCNVLFSVWPSYDESWIGDALVAFRGKKFVYIGEGVDGCTGGKNLFSELAENWELVGTHVIPTWVGMHDKIWFYTRKNSSVKEN